MSEPVLTAPTSTLVPRAVLLERLRAYVTNANPATLTCVFAPGGRLRGAGIVSHFYCAHCNQSRHVHDVAAIVRDLEGEESK